MIHNADAVNISSFLRPDQQLRVAIHLPDDTIIDLNAVITRIDRNTLHLETFLSNIKQLAMSPKGARVIVISSETWAFCRGQGLLEATAPPHFAVSLHGDFEVQQRREFFRMDVFIPVAYAVPEDQQMSAVEGMWKARRMLLENCPPPRTAPFQGSFKVINWNDGPDILPCRVNLSGGGVRIKIPEELTPGTSLDLDIFLPLMPVKVVSAVVSVIRSTEVVLNLEPTPSFVTAMRFVHLSERDRESIISYIFNEQRNSLRIQSEK